MANLSAKKQLLITLPKYEREVLEALAQVQRVGESKHSNVGMRSTCVEAVSNYAVESCPLVFGLTFAEYVAKRKRNRRVPLLSFGIAPEILCPPDPEFENQEFTCAPEAWMISAAASAAVADGRV